MDSVHPPLQPRCAICNAPPFPECHHEGERLELALHQAQDRWAGVQRISDWVLNQARLQVLHLFARAKASRLEAHIQYLHTLPYYGLWQHYNGRPPLPPREFAYLQDQLRNAETNLRIGVDADWRKACLMYPEMLDYFFGLVEINFPDEKSEMVVRPQPGRRRARRDSGHSDRGSSKKGRGRS